MVLHHVKLPGNADGYELLAGGSLGHPPSTLSPRFERRLWLLLELGLFFIGVPLLLCWVIHDLHVPLIAVLQPLLFGFVAYLLWDDTFHVRRELLKGFAWRHLVWIATVFAIVGGAITLATIEIYPHVFLSMPYYRPMLWLAVLVLYPLLSVIPQELVYRTFFFHRYGAAVRISQVACRADQRRAVRFCPYHFRQLDRGWRLRGRRFDNRLSLLDDAVVLGGVVRAHALWLPDLHGRARSLLLYGHRQFLTGAQGQPHILLSQCYGLDRRARAWSAGRSGLELRA